MSREKLLTKNQRTKLYYVILPDDDDVSEVCYALIRTATGKLKIELIARREVGIREDTRLTEIEIKQLDKRYWPFAAPAEG
ncbi:DUF1642 domain-containing protein [Enterococcus mundtii]|uniref:DUF1642 domain-containing protein n=1 Tax=Enterococcus mundtii TaxID=53346 RepID=UPI0023036EC4|nr:DUF1642 domain-containing protein [Enterococcus mundtii]